METKKYKINMFPIIIKHIWKCENCGIEFHAPFIDNRFVTPPRHFCGSIIPYLRRERIR